jgi:hypothetical protein
VRVLLAGLFWLACAGATAAQSAPAWGLPQLMASLAGVKAASAQFTERKTMAVLNAPLIETGLLRYQAPDRMEKMTLTPAPENFVLDAGQVSLTGADGRTHSFSLGQAPAIGGLAAGILATLAGDEPALEAIYHVRCSGGPAGWQLLLQPKDPALGKIIDWIAIRGRFADIDEIDTQSQNGDHSEMSIVENAR